METKESHLLIIQKAWIHVIHLLTQNTVLKDCAYWNKKNYIESKQIISMKTFNHILTQYWKSTSSLWPSKTPLEKQMQSKAHWNVSKSPNKPDAVMIKTRLILTRGERRRKHVCLGLSRTLSVKAHWRCLRRRRQFTYHGLGEGSGQGEEQRVHPPASMQGGVHHVPGVHRVRRDPTRGQAAVEFAGEEDVTEFGPVVSQHGPVVIFRWRKAAKV